jgi:hypothetical protein
VPIELNLLLWRGSSRQVCCYEIQSALHNQQDSTLLQCDRSGQCVLLNSCLIRRRWCASLSHVATCLGPPRFERCSIKTCWSRAPKQKQCDGAVVMPLRTTPAALNPALPSTLHVSCAGDVWHPLACRGCCCADDAVGRGRCGRCSCGGCPGLPDRRCALGEGAVAAPPASPAGWRTTYEAPVDCWHVGISQEAWRRSTRDYCCSCCGADVVACNPCHA